LLGAASARLFVLTDIAREYYWTGSGFLRVDDESVVADDLVCFASRQEAEATASTLRASGIDLTAAVWPGR
jgi:hypothetical protein